MFHPKDNPPLTDANECRLQNPGKEMQFLREPVVDRLDDVRTNSERLEKSFLGQKKSICLG